MGSLKLGINAYSRAYDQYVKRHRLYSKCPMRKNNFLFVLQSKCETERERVRAR